MTKTVASNWYPDPTKRHDLRYWDGNLWTDHVVSQHVQSVDPLVPPATTADQSQVVDIEAAPQNKKVTRQIRKADAEVDGWRGGGTLLTESVLAINQKPKRFEQQVEYEVFDPMGRILGEVRESGFNYLSSVFTVHSASTRKRELEVVDRSGAVLYRLNRPAKVFKPRVELLYANGTQAGLFSQNSLFSRKLALEVGGGTVVGHIEFEDAHVFRATVRDAAGQAVALVKRTWAGRRAERRTRADNYVLEIKHPTLENPLLGFVLTSAIVIDLLYQQGEPSKDAAKRERKYRRWHGA